MPLVPVFLGDALSSAPPRNCRIEARFSGAKAVSFSDARRERLPKRFGCPGTDANPSAVNAKFLSSGAALFVVGIATGSALSDAAIAGAAAPGCVSPAQWVVLERDRAQVASPAALFAQIAKRQVVLLGESHDQEDDHRWQLQVLAALQAERPNMVIGFEMFPRRVQPALDRWVAGELTIKDFLEQSDWENVWRLPASFYLPLFEFARINRVPMVALNVDEKLTKRIGEKGWDAVPEREREGVGRPVPPSSAYRDFLLSVYEGHAKEPPNGSTAAKTADPAFDYFVEAQTTWDRAMAEALARSLRRSDTDKPLVVGIMGSGHVRFGYGVPHQLRALGVTSIGTLLPVRSDFDCQELRSGVADAVFALPPVATAKPSPPRLGVRLEDKDGVRIVAVTPGSLADTTGLKADDRLLQIAGSDVRNTAAVIAAVGQQPAGTWLPVRVKRGDQTLDLVIRFPVQR